MAKRKRTKGKQKTNDRATWAPLKIRGELSCSGRVAVPA